MPATLLFEIKVRRIDNPRFGGVALQLSGPPIFLLHCNDYELSLAMPDRRPKPRAFLLIVIAMLIAGAATVLLATSLLGIAPLGYNDGSARLILVIVIMLAVLVIALAASAMRRRSRTVL